MPIVSTNNYLNGMQNSSVNSLPELIDKVLGVYSSDITNGKDYLDSPTPIDNLKEIGKPNGFPINVDPMQRIKNYYTKKMNTIDIIPCQYKIELSKAYESTKQGDIVKGLLPKIEFDESIKEYKKICELYDLEPYEGVRIATTDDTQASDQITNQYSSNVIQQFMDKMSNIGKTLKDVGQYFFSPSEVSDAIKSGTTKGVEGAGKILSSSLGINMSATQQKNIESSLQSIGEVLLKGNKVSLPKIWSTSEYHPGLTLMVKLVSPYGHPKAIKKFIIEPLAYLIILASPKTPDGVSYGYPFTVMVRAYGMSHMNVATINNITMRRGGPDTCYNIYFQPLEIDVSMTFSPITDGFAVFRDEDNMGNETTLNDAEDDVSTDALPGSNSPLMPTLGNIIDSLRPFGYTG